MLQLQIGHTMAGLLILVRVRCPHPRRVVRRRGFRDGSSIAVDARGGRLLSNSNTRGTSGTRGRTHLGNLVLRIMSVGVMLRLAGLVERRRQ